MSDIANGIRTYLVYGISPNFRHDLFHAFLKDSVDILAFWNHIPLMYFVKAKLSADMLFTKFQPFYGNDNFIIAEINPLNMNGWMTDQAWRWFQTPAPTDKAPTTPQTSLLAALYAKHLLDE